MFHVVLLEPEIPQNTGNIIRLCANSGATLHLIRPLGFQLDDRQMKRAGLDYREWMDMQVHDSLAGFRSACPDSRLFGFSTRGNRYYSDVRYQTGDALLFGPETRGLPEAVRRDLAERVLRIPMQPQSRSLNLGNSVAIVVYEAWRQQGFGLET
ncbi:tRNA (cytidine/uridine-2'-O-)-methyltransferase [Methylohalomonas lacus]|uniref:tRNA (cytidine(34)-2'-O)-methyltransferase n=1 Tax=Methylohalomonas lacus TaxID=398773 RepID=A0AAE3HMB8_9GAMM|nr:tRNA (uridine(34)/cytosine(34)/5-carboxymethylaminomethyluridine(34)-2'-O)-methyltransferase TrmL [Methylohalomonas lacus]MCS3904490.1 tRNA (cytidine/uridine-2'-O-)-methyltransferase [Methylohalomonas lacus]